MRLLFILAATLALSLAESDEKHYEDSLAAESIELQKTHDLKSSATVYNSVPYPSWTQQQQYPPSNPVWTKPQVPYVPPVNPPQYIPEYPQNPPHVQSDYVPPQNPPHYHYPITTTPVPVIKNEQHLGDNGSYKYEYQIADGTWVGEEGYFTRPNQDEKSLVKKGWYSYVGGDGKKYTVTWWADHTGYHAFGDHLPVPPPIPPAIQASIDQNAKEEAAKAEAEKNKPYYTTTYRPIYYDPPQQAQYPQPQQPYYPPQPQQPYYPPQPQQPYYPPQG